MANAIVSMIDLFRLRRPLMTGEITLAPGDAGRRPY